MAKVPFVKGKLTYAKEFTGGIGEKSQDFWWV
jgi:hypothetical protein